MTITRDSFGTFMDRPMSLCTLDNGWMKARVAGRIFRRFIRYTFSTTAGAREA